MTSSSGPACTRSENRTIRSAPLTAAARSPRSASPSRPPAGDVIEALEQPRASFAGHTLETPWTTLQLAYFVGTAMWTYLTQPFTFALPGFKTTELDPWQEKANSGGGCA